MKRQGIIEAIIGAAGIAVLVIFQNHWSYVPLCLYGVLSVVMIRRADTEFTEAEKACMKKRNIFALFSLLVFAAICYFSSNATIKDNYLWILLSVYLFLCAHGIMFIAPVNAFGNEKE